MTLRVILEKHPVMSDTRFNNIFVSHDVYSVMTILFLKDLDIL